MEFPKGKIINSGNNKIHFFLVNRYFIRLGHFEKVEFESVIDIIELYVLRNILNHVLTQFFHHINVVIVNFRKKNIKFLRT